MALLRINADEIFDIAVLSMGGMELFPSLGNGAFGPADLRPDYYGLSLLPTDLDFDGDDDIVWATGYGPAYAHGDGSGSFTDPVLILDNPQDTGGKIVMAEMTGDGVPDFVTLGAPYYTDLVVIPHDGTAALAATGWFTIPFTDEYPSGFDVGDVDGDGLSDVVWQDQDNSRYDVRTHLMLGEPGGFGQPTDIAQHGWGGAVVIADVNADGRNDVVALHAAGYALTVVLSTAAGVGAAQLYEFSSGASLSDRSLSVADVDCDGCPDVVVADVWGLNVFRGEGCGQ